MVPGGQQNYQREYFVTNMNVYLLCYTLKLYKAVLNPFSLEPTTKRHLP